MSSIEIISDNGLRHLMEAVFTIDPSDNLYQLVREKCNSVKLFRERLKDVNDVKAFKYAGMNSTISNEDVERLRSMYSFLNNQQNMWGESDVVGLVAYNKLTSAQYEGYMAMKHDKDNIINYDPSIACKHTVNSPLRSVMNGTNTTTTTTSPTRTSNNSSNAGLKRSIDMFIVFNDVSQWKEWFHEFIRILNLMDAKNAIDPTYSPSNDVEREKLKDDKTFVSTVLGRVMKEDAGDQILKDHEDPTVAWPLIVKTYTQGPKAAVQARKYMKFLSTAVIPENIKEWDNVPLLTQFEEFVEKRRLYNACAIKPMPDDTFKSNLERFVMNVPDLRQVTTQINLDIVKTNVEPSLHEYLEYYRAQAISFDEVHGLTKKLSTPSSSRMPTKNKNIASLTINELMGVSVLPQLVHKELTDEDKKLWAKMSPEGRKGIVKWGASGGKDLAVGINPCREVDPTTPLLQVLHARHNAGPMSLINNLLS